MLIDTHAHITFGEFANEVEDVIKRSFASNTQIINASSNYQTSVAAVELAAKYDGLWAVVGCHPDDIEQDEFDFSKYKQLAQSSKKVVGIGEVGLDYYRLDDNAKKIKTQQKEVFMQFIRLSQELDLPLVLHCRGTKDNPFGAYDEMLEIIKQQLTTNNQQLKGVIHCFGGNEEQARKFLDLGFYIGFTGIVTFKNAKELQGIAQAIPLDKILIETDAPFLAPEPFRGQRNEPAYVKYVGQKIAELKGLDFITVEEQTYKNAWQLFKLFS